MQEAMRSSSKVGFSREAVTSRLGESMLEVNRRRWMVTTKNFVFTFDNEIMDAAPTEAIPNQFLRTVHSADDESQKQFSFVAIVNSRK